VDFEGLGGRVNRTLSLEATEGDVRLEVTGTPAAYVEQQTQPGLKLLKKDSDLLIAKLRDRYGSVDDDAQQTWGDVYAVIDVEASAGVPADRWVYAWRPAWCIFSFDARRGETSYLIAHPRHAPRTSTPYS